jgi:hypothetical protein
MLRTGKLQSLASLVASGHGREVTKHLREWNHSDSFAYGLRRDLTVPFGAPKAKIPISVRPLERGDELSLLDADIGSADGTDLYERLNRREFIEAGIPTGYVAVTSEGKPCYMQFLIGPAENERVARYFGEFFPNLAPDEALLEYAFTPASFQRLGIMSCAMAQIAERGRDLGARWVVTFVHQDNLGALKGCQRAGFSLYLVRHERWRLFRRRVSFQRLSEGTPYPFEQAPQAHA